MTYYDFLGAFAQMQKLGSVNDLLGTHAKRYASQIESRSRAQQYIEDLHNAIGLDWNGLRVLELSCNYGAQSVELAKLGAKVVGCDASAKWLELAQINAQYEAQPSWINCDVSLRSSRKQLVELGPFDLVLANDIFDRTYDSAGLMDNLRVSMASHGQLVFKITNARGTRNVIQDTYKKLFGISLLAPDYWPLFVTAPFQIYYRRWEHWLALFEECGFASPVMTHLKRDESLELTQKHIESDIRKIRRHLKQDNFLNTTQFKFVRMACQQYCKEVEEDLQGLAWDDLYLKYRLTAWKGIIQAAPG